MTDVSSQSPLPAPAQAPAPESAGNSQPVRQRVRSVSPRSLVDFQNTRELAHIMLDAIGAHKHLYEDADMLHGDINPNTIVIFTFDFDADGPTDASAEGSAAPARAVGALIDYDGPIRVKKQ